MLCLVTDRRRSLGRPVEAVVEAAVKGGVDIVQLRERELPAASLLDLAVRLRSITAGRALLFVNDRVDVALAAGADGVQLGERSIPVEAARRACGDSLIVGRSVHSVEGAVEANRAGADLLVFGTVFATSSHPGVRPLGGRYAQGSCAAGRWPVPRHRRDHGGERRVGRGGRRVGRSGGQRGKREPGSGARGAVDTVGACGGVGAGPRRRGGLGMRVLVNAGDGFPPPYQVRGHAFAGMTSRGVLA